MTLYDCAMGHPDCSHCQAANRSLGCLWCSHDQPACVYGPLCPPEAVELLCPTPSIDTVSPPAPTLASVLHSSPMAQSPTPSLTPSPISLALSLTVLASPRSEEPCLSLLS